MRIIIVAVFAITRKNILIFFYFTNLVLFALVRKAERKNICIYSSLTTVGYATLKFMKVKL